MKKTLLLWPLLALTACGPSETNSSSVSPSLTPSASDPTSEVGGSTEHSVLVAYYSATGTTEKIAGYIHDGIDSDLFEIVPVDPYTSEDLDYYSGGRCDQENADDSIRPEIVGEIEGMDSYDVIFLGYPIWYGKAPKIIWTFLESYDFSSKVIIPFCTSGSSGISASVSNIQALVPDSTMVEEGRRFSGSSGAAEVVRWAEGQLAAI